MRALRLPGSASNQLGDHGSAPAPENGKDTISLRGYWEISETEPESSKDDPRESRALPLLSLEQRAPFPAHGGRPSTESSVTINDASTDRALPRASLILRSSQLGSHLTYTSLGTRKHRYTHFTDEETEAMRGLA